MFKSMISLAVGVAFLAILFSVWGIQLPFADGQKVSHVGSQAVFQRRFSPSGWGTNRISEFCKEAGKHSRVSPGEVRVCFVLRTKHRPF